MGRKTRDQTELPKPLQAVKKSLGDNITAEGIMGLDGAQRKGAFSALNSTLKATNPRLTTSSKS